MPPASDDRLQRLLDLVGRLRAPDGCPWDREQEVGDLRAYLLEEAHEVAAAIDRRDWDEMEAEAGDLLFLLAFLVRLAEERGAFTMSRLVERTAAKVVARHPHVFGSAQLPDTEAVREAWEKRKVEQNGGDGSLLDGVSPSLPSLLAAYRMTQKAAGVGFDWPDAAAVLEKIDEELAEVREELRSGSTAAENRPALGREIGDLLFTVANLARHHKIDPEAALAEANLRFRRRFEHIEEGLRRRGRSLTDADLDEMEELWQEAKRV